jgi:hypothetical protein
MRSHHSTEAQLTYTGTSPQLRLFNHVGIIKPLHQTLVLTKWLTELRNSAKHEKVPVGKQHAHAPGLATMAHERILELLKTVY